MGASKFIELVAGLRSAVDTLPIGEVVVAESHFSKACDLLGETAVGAGERLQETVRRFASIRERAQTALVAMVIAANQVNDYGCAIGAAPWPNADGGPQAERPQALSSRYFSIDRHGTTRPRDPVTGDTLAPGQLPPSLLEVFSRGFAYWRRHAASLRVTIVQAPHQHSPDGWQADLRDEARRLSRNHGILYVDGAGTQDAQEERQEILAAASRISPAVMERSVADRLRAAAPQTAEVAIPLAGTNIPVECADYTVDGNRPADSALARLHKMCGDAERATQELSSVRSARTLNAAVLACQLNLSASTYRSAYFVGRVGEDLDNRHTAGAPATDITLLVSHASAPVAGLLRPMGVSVTVRGALPPDGQNDGAGHYLDCVARGSITPADFAHLMAPVPSAA